MEYCTGGNVAIVGGGQLALMMVQAANRIGVKTTVLTKESDCPCSFIDTNLSLFDPSYFSSSWGNKAIEELDPPPSVVTFDYEGVDVSGASRNLPGYIICPSVECLSIIQNKFKQKTFFKEKGIPTAQFSSIQKTYERGVFPFLIKSNFGSYDGRGVIFVGSKSEMPAMEELDNHYVEEYVNFDKELSVIVARRRCPVKDAPDLTDFDQSGFRFVKHEVEVFNYPVTESFHCNGILHVSKAPADIHPSIKREAEELACRTIAALPVERGPDGKDTTAGIFGVELFLVFDTKEDKESSKPNFKLFVNEICCRPHNTGHYTMDACLVSQFEQHLRCILSIPLKPMVMREKYALMINALGNSKLGIQSLLDCFQKSETLPANVHVYTYRKKFMEGRKLGHINIVGSTLEAIKEGWSHVMKYKWFGDDFLKTLDQEALLRWEEATNSRATKIHNAVDNQPLVSIIMGSISDLEVMTGASSLLSSMQIPFEMTIVSAHRTPERLYEYASSVMKRGIKVVIAGAGGAAHLPGMVSSLTSVPVIGVPVKSRALLGIDSLLSIVQMPPDIPVATMAIDNSKNAAVLAARILGLSNPAILDAVKAFEQASKDKVFESIKQIDEKKPN